VTLSPTPAQAFATWQLYLCQALAARIFPGGLSNALVALIIAKIRTLAQRFARVAGRVAAGTYRPRRRSTNPRKTTPNAPRRPSPLPLRRNWLLPLLPDAAAYGCQLENLFRDPEMAALLAAAPEAMARILRPLCWMLAATPPPLLARPRPAAPPAPEATSQAPPPAAPSPPVRAAKPASPPRQWRPRQNTPPRRRPLPA
jgi:hypothetical protein